MTFEIRKGDTEPPLKATLLGADDEPLHLDDVTRVDFRMGTYSKVVLEGRATITDRDAGEVMYRWNRGDTEKAGKYKAEFRVHRSNGDRVTVPSEGTFFVKIVSEIGN